MSIKEQRAATLKAANDIVAKAKAEDRDLTPDEISDIEAKTAEIVEFDKTIANQAKGAQVLSALGAVAPDQETPGGFSGEAKARSLGEHFVKSVGADTLRNAKGVNGASVMAPEFKASTDTSVTGGTGGALSPLVTQIDANVVRTDMDDLTPVSNLLGQGVITIGSAITFFTEGAIEGDVTSVAEGGTKPQVHFVNPTPTTVALSKLAGWTNVTDEYFDDLPMLAAEINNRLVRRVARTLEYQTLNGAGTGSDLKGLLNVSGIQTIANVTKNDVLAFADAILTATGMIEGNAYGVTADAVVLNRADYVALRTKKDANNQYMGGGYFTGAYGTGSIANGSQMWGELKTVISPFIPAGTALVGAFADAATLYGKGGVSVAMSNSHADNFTNNRVTLRAEVRKALAVRMPAGFVKISYSLT